MDPILIEFLALAVLIAANGVLAMAELAVVAARKVRLERLEQAGLAAARTVLRLAGAPSRFLATVQLGITLIGVVAGAIGGVTLAGRLAGPLASLPVVGPHSRSVSMAIVVIAITFVTLVLGELVPKRIALARSEKVALRLAPAMDRLAWLARPFVHILSASTDAITKLFHVHLPTEPSVTEEDIRTLIHRGTIMGVFDPAEREMVERVFSLADRTVGAVMTPYPDIRWLDVSHDRTRNLEIVATSGHSSFPVVRDSRDHVLGIVQARELFAQTLRGGVVDVAAAVKPALLVPAVTPVLLILERMRQQRSTVALVIDEYGALQGMVTATDLLEALVGEMPRIGPPGTAPEVVRRSDGSWLLDGALPVEEVRIVLGLDELPGEHDIVVGTLGGFVMANLGRVPREGDRFEWRGWSFEVMDMDERRVDKVLVVPPPRPPEASNDQAAPT